MAINYQPHPSFRGELSQIHSQKTHALRRARKGAITFSPLDMTIEAARLASIDSQQAADLLYAAGCLHVSFRNHQEAVSCFGRVKALHEDYNPLDRGFSSEAVISLDDPLYDYKANIRLRLGASRETWKQVSDIFSTSRR